MKILKVLARKLIFGPTIHELYRRSRINYLKGGFYRIYSEYLDKKIIRNFGCHLSSKAVIGNNVKLKHPVGIVIGDGVIIEDDVSIYQNVTLGAARVGEGDCGMYPHICEGVTIFAGAKIFGKIKIGANSSIGANAVVLADVPPNSIAVGIPARVIS